MFYYNPLVLTREAKKSFKHNSLKLEDSFGKISGFRLALELFSIQGVDAQYCATVGGPYNPFNLDEENLSTLYYPSSLKMTDCLMTMRKEGEMEMSNIVLKVSCPTTSQITRMKTANIVNLLGTIEFSDLYQLEEINYSDDLN